MPIPNPESATNLEEIADAIYRISTTVAPSIIPGAVKKPNTAGVQSQTLESDSNLNNFHFATKPMLSKETQNPVT
jgi:hypothetical protein